MNEQDSLRDVADMVEDVECAAMAAEHLQTGKAVEAAGHAALQLSMLRRSE